MSLSFLSFAFPRTCARARSTTASKRDTESNTFHSMVSKTINTHPQSHTISPFTATTLGDAMPSPSQKNADAAAAAAVAPPPLPPVPPSNNWGPYSSAKDFDANMATVLVVLVCATALTFGLHAFFRLLLSRLRRHGPPRDTEKPRAEAEAAPQLPGSVVVFSAGATAVAGAPECAICLAELAEGERVRVMPACGHGFHAQCVDAWLAGRSSCPTCRADWRPSAAAAEP